MRASIQNGARLAVLAVLAAVVAGSGTGCSKEEGGAPAPGRGETVPGENPPVAIAKPPVGPSSVEPPPVVKVPAPTPGRDQARAAFKERFSKVFGGAIGIQSTNGVRKFDESWEKSLEPLLGTRLAEYRQKFAVLPAEPAPEGDAGTKKKKKKASKKAGVPAPIRSALEEKVFAAFDPAWGVADADLPRLNAALSLAFRAAKGHALPGEDPSDVGRPRPPEGPAGPSDESLDRGAPDGFGSQATGGGGAPVKRVHPNAYAIAAALEGGGSVQIAKGDLDCEFGEITVGGNTTLDGGGTTLWYPGSDHNGRGLQLFGSNIVLRNIRVRNAGDGISLGGMTFKKTSNVHIENVSATGCGDDGFSPSYDCKDITFRWSFLAGNARCIFFKYGGTNLTVHHSVLTHYWIRGPLVSGGSIDFRNNLVQNWSMWGSRVEGGGKGNFVNNVWRREGWSGGKADSALYAGDGGGAIHSSGNVFEGCSARAEGFAGSPVVEAPGVATEGAKEAVERILSDTTGAGCMPRDGIDKAYLALKTKCPGGDPPHGLQVDETRKRLKGAEAKAPPEGDGKAEPPEEAEPKE